MALQVWLPLMGDLNNQGLSDINFTNENTSTLTINTDGKIGKCYQRATEKTAGRISSNSNILLNGDLSMCCWAKVTTTAGNSANGLVTNHSHADNTGFGITVKQVSTDDYRISCNTGNGSSRTYQTYYGTTNIKGAWHHLALTYNNDLAQFQLWVDGKVEKTESYTNSAKEDKIMLFDWSTTYNSVNYRPACLLNDVRIYDHCLSSKEVEELAKGLVVHYKLDDPYVEPTSNFLYGKTLAGHGSQWTLQTEKLNNYPIYKNVVNNPNTGNNAGFRYTTSEPITLTGSKITISFWKRLNTVYGKNLGGYIRFKDANNNNINGSWVYSKSNWANDATSIGKWEYITATATINNYANATSFNCFYVYVDNAPGGDCDFSQIQIEFKDHATPYTESNRTWFIEDCSGYLKHGTLVDNTIQMLKNSKRYSYCLKNNVATNVNTYPFYGECNIPPSDALTITWWMNLTQWGHQNSGLFSTSNTTLATDYNTTAANMRDSAFDTCDTNGNMVRLTNIPNGVTINEWHQYSFVYDGSKLYFYKDGIVQRSVDRTGTLKAFKYIIPFYSCAGGARRSSSGYLSDFRIYVTALTANQLIELFNTSVSIDSKGNVYPRELVEE